MSELIVYSRRGCHLCEQLLGEIEPLARGRASITVRDVDENPDWCEAFGHRVPVVVCEDEELCEFFLDRDAVWRKIGPPAQE